MNPEIWKLRRTREMNKLRVVSCPIHILNNALLTLHRGNSGVRLMYNLGHASQAEFEWKQLTRL